MFIDTIYNICVSFSSTESGDEEAEEEKPSRRSYFLREHKPRTKLYEAPIGQNSSPDKKNKRSMSPSPVTKKKLRTYYLRKNKPKTQHYMAPIG